MDTFLIVGMVIVIIVVAVANLLHVPEARSGNAEQAVASVALEQSLQSTDPTIKTRGVTFTKSRCCELRL